MKVFVTGGAGYIGSHIVNLLIDQNFKVTVYDNLSTGFKTAVHPAAEFIQGDVRDFETLKQAIETSRPDSIIHMAAKLSVPESVVEPLSYYDNNTNGMLTLLKVCEVTKMRKVVFSSTAAVYGNTKTTGVYSENCSLGPLNPYGFSKMFAEQILQDAENKIQIKSVILRYFNVSGASVSGNNGQRTQNSSQLIKRVAEAASGSRMSVSIYGNDYNTPDGTCVRDYIHVEDLAQIHIEALKYLANSNSKSEIVNCGYGAGYSVKEIVTTMKKVSGADFQVNQEARRAGDAEVTIADTSKLKQLFNQWKPKFNDLQVICKSSFDWEYKKRQL